LKPGGAPPETASDELFATPDGAVGSPDVGNVHDGVPTRPVDDDVVDGDPEDDGRAPTGHAAGGGYGTPSATSSGGTGEATDETSSPGADAQSEWLRDAPGGAR
jgi:hypothetical protein